MSEPLLTEIRDLLASIDAKLTPPQTKTVFNVKLGRVFSAGQNIPATVDLLVAPNGLRWKRVFDDMQVGLDQWYPRDVDGPIVSTNDLLGQAGHVTEIPAPGSEDRT